MKKKILITLFTFLILISVGCGKKAENKKENTENTDTEVIENENNENENKENTEQEVTKAGKREKMVIEKVDYNDYKIANNSVGDFDLFFLKIDSKYDSIKQNRVYSPLSIKYALEMLEEGASGDTKTQISNIIGTYNVKKYDNNSNMSFANAIFIKDSYKNNIKSSYTNLLKTKYNAEVVYDSFETVDKINKWISDKTFNLINDLIDNVSDKNFVLVNALAIDMEWVNKIQPVDEDGSHYSVDYQLNHIDFSTFLEPYGNEKGDDESLPAKIDAVVNRYDAVKVLGKDKIKQTVKNAYAEWLADPNRDSCETNDPDVDTYIKQTITDQYYKEMQEVYNDINSSTDFEFYDDKDVKVFAKDLKEYNGTTLQYVGIMPKNEDIDKYIEKVSAKDINNLIGNLKTIELKNFKDGVITHIYGSIPMFKFDYEIDLVDELGILGVTDVFDVEKSDLSNITDDKQYINQAVHRSTIEFSNDGIKASAVTETGGWGGGDCGFNYYFEPPIENIDLTFDKPYIFLIRDKHTGEVWFVGANYTSLAEKAEY